MSARTVESFAEIESLLRRHHRELDLLFRSAPVGLALLDQQLRYLMANDILARWHGIALRDLSEGRYRESFPAGMNRQQRASKNRSAKVDPSGTGAFSPGQTWRTTF